MIDLIGKTIKSIRNLNQTEMDDEGWDGNCICLVLDDGTILYPSSDGEGNNHGFLFGRQGKKEFVLNTKFL